MSFFPRGSRAGVVLLIHPKTGRRLNIACFILLGHGVVVRRGHGDGSVWDGSVGVTRRFGVLGCVRVRSARMSNGVVVMPVPREDSGRRRTRSFGLGERNLGVPRALLPNGISAASCAVLRARSGAKERRWFWSLLSRG